MRESGLLDTDQHIRHQLGEGEIRPTEVILAYDGEKGEELDTLYLKHRIHTYRTFEKHALNLGFVYDEIRLYYDVRRSLSLRGDIYVFISDIELGLHEFVRQTLISSFGPGESQWWRKGVPTSVRKTCAQCKEEDPDPVSELYSYTTFIHLSDIIEANWTLFRPLFPEKMIHSRKSLMELLRQLNQLRNAIMHPVKKKPWRPAELQALKVIHDLLQSICSGPIQQTHSTKTSPCAA